MLVGLIAPWREPHTPVLAALLQRGRRARSADGSIDDVYRLTG